MEIGWTDVGSRGYILVSCAHSNTSYRSVFIIAVDNIMYISYTFHYISYLKFKSSIVLTNYNRNTYFLYLLCIYKLGM